MTLRIVPHHETSASMREGDVPTPARALGLIPSCALVCEGLLDRLPVALLLIDEAGTIRSANDFALALLGREREAIEGHAVDECLVPLEQLVASIGRGECRIATRRPDGAVLELACSTAQIAATRGPGPYAVIVRAATALESDEIHRLAAMGAAVPAMVHRVKNSLMAVTMGLELLEQLAPTAQTDDHVRSALGEANDVVLTLDGFGAMGRPLRIAGAVDPTHMLHDARLRIGEKADRSGLRLVWLVDHLPRLSLDATVVHALLVNLVCQALRDCDRGDEVRVEVRLDDGALEIAIRDNGHHAGARTAVPVELALVRRVVEAAGGTLASTTEADGSHLHTLRIDGATGADPRAHGETRPR